MAENDEVKTGLLILFSLFIFLTISALMPMFISLGNCHAFSELTETQLEQLKRGEILIKVIRTGKSTKGTVEAIILINAPAEKIWQIILDCQQIPTFIPEVKSCQVLESGKNWEIIRHEVKWIWLFPKISYVFRANYQENRKIDFAKIKGDLKEMKGSWQLDRLNENGQTIVRYSVYLDPGFFIPQWLVRRSLKADLPAVLKALQAKILDSQSKE